jgi:hypothetical protein
MDYLLSFSGSKDIYSIAECGKNRAKPKGGKMDGNVQCYRSKNVFTFSPQKSYLQISRALKSFEERKIYDLVMMRKVPNKRNQYKFYPDL